MNPASVFAPASLQAARLTEMTWLLIGLTTLVALVTLACAALALRRRRRDVPVAAWIVGGGLVMPIGVLSALLLYGTWRTDAASAALAPNALVVSVTGRLWWWEIRYVDPASGRSVAVANELRLPVGRPVRLALASADVIHSFWVPELGGKVDLVPGRLHHVSIDAVRPGVYRGPCAEFCGTQHARMTLHVVAEEPAAFDRWLAGQAVDAGEPAGAAARGRVAFAERGCAACHTVRGVSEARTVGPDLTHVASRLHLGAGVLRNEPGAFGRWITGVQALKPGAHMPALDGADAATVDALAAYLETLR
ncbi:cytochrome c oxidase subunit II [Piscinibacter koreensis]|uniref:C-type cytochrome n=1 Tax=Piscinibacter koreensis TaxID=2742824 RepID=A0A7Y6NPL8_9BURK|nr:c-type cytochrome [Schlegelella koreensis]NUZ07015.1 c-type cytochrome [Schlegelella koreensis]